MYMLYYHTQFSFFFVKLLRQRFSFIITAGFPTRYVHPSSCAFQQNLNLAFAC